MKARLTAWLSVLLLVSACFGLPVTRGAATRITVEIVCEQKDRRIVQPAAAAPVPLRNPAPERVAVQPPPALLLDHALFQRPPPAA